LSASNPRQPKGATGYSGFAGPVDHYVATPPDTEGAVGPNDVVTMLNSDVLIQSRSGEIRPNYPISLQDFWSGLGSFTKLFDPRIEYDAGAGRWIASSSANPWVSSAALLLAVSATSNPAGDWRLFEIQIGTQGYWADFPVLGFNQSWITISANLLYLPPTGSYANTELYVFNKADLYQSSGKPAYTTFSDDQGAFTPAIDLDRQNPGVMYFAQALGGPAGGNIRISVLQGPVGLESFIPGAANIQVGDSWAEAAPGDSDFAPQLGTWVKIDTGDSRLQNCVLRNGSVWCAHTVFVPSDKPTRSAVEWFEADPILGRLVQRGRVDDPTSANFYAYPSISVNKNNDVLVGYSRFTARDYPSAGFSFRAGGDPANAMQAGVIFKSGEAPYVAANSDESSNRWGDISATMVDPSDDLAFWTIQEYAATPVGYNTGRWGTWWAQVTRAAASSGSAR
jgi:hypothetical protein